MFQHLLLSRKPVFALYSSSMLIRGDILHRAVSPGELGGMGKRGRGMDECVTSGLLYVTAPLLQMVPELFSDSSRMEDLGTNL